MSACTVGLFEYAKTFILTGVITTFALPELFKGIAGIQDTGDIIGDESNAYGHVWGFRRSSTGALTSLQRPRRKPIPGNLSACGQQQRQHRRRLRRLVRHNQRLHPAVEICCLGMGTVLPAGRLELRCANLAVDSMIQPLTAFLGLPPIRPFALAAARLAALLDLPPTRPSLDAIHRLDPSNPSSRLGR